MAQKQINILAGTQTEADKRAEILQLIEDSLDSKQLENLGRIAKSTKAQGYLTGAKFLTLKGFLKL